MHIFIELLLLQKVITNRLNSYLTALAVGCTRTSAYDIVQLTIIIQLSFDYVSSIRWLIADDAMSPFKILSEWCNVHLKIHTICKPF